MIDSDVSVISRKFLRKIQEKIPVKRVTLRYPTGERVPIICEAIAKIQIDRFSKEISVFVAEIANDCLLEINFLKEGRFGKNF